MARLPRLFMPSCAQHIIQRGNNRNDCFFEKKDYKVYLGKLREASQQNKVAIHAFVLMTNHVHLLASSSEKYAVSNMMQSLGRFYVRYINHKYKRTGTLWEGRFKSTVVDEANYLFTLYRYIELNPVRAGMVAHPAEYPWSSYHANALGEKRQLTTPHQLYLQLGQSENEILETYKSLVNQVLPETTLLAIRDATNKGWVLGGQRFLHRIEKTLNRRGSQLSKGGNNRLSK